MNSRLLCIGLLITLSVGLRAAGPAEPIPLFPDGAPGARGMAEADRPTLTPYLPPEEARTGAALVFCPGGGYSQISFNAERRALVEWLASKGIAVFVLHYRHGGNGYRYPAPMQDVARAMRWVRTKAEEYRIDPQRIGVLGASAGGHLAAYASTRFDAGRTEAEDPVERASSRPDFAVLLYPVLSLTDPTLTHAGSRKHLVGDGAEAEALARSLSAEAEISPQTPPTFLVYGGQDTTTPPANGAVYYLALRRAKIPAEAHLFETGPHGFGLPTKDPALAAWQGLLETWLRRRGAIK